MKLALSVFLALVLFASCGDYEEKCRGQKVGKYEFPSLQSALFAPVDTFNFLMDTIRLSIDSTYPYSRVGLAIGPETIVKVAGLRSGIFQQAYAVCNSEGTNSDPLVDLKIYSDHAYNDTFPAGADLRRVFLFNTYGYDRRIGSIFGNIRDQDSTITRITPEIRAIWGYLDINQYMIFTPEIPPKNDGSHRFKIVLTTEKRNFTINFPSIYVEK